MAASVSFSCLAESIKRGLLDLTCSVLRPLLSCRRTESTASSLLRSASILSIVLRLLAIVSVKAILISISLIIGGVVRGYVVRRRRVGALLWLTLLLRLILALRGR